MSRIGISRGLAATRRVGASLFAGGLLLGASSSVAFASDMITLYMQGYVGTGSERVNIGFVLDGPGVKDGVVFAFAPDGMPDGLANPKLTVRSSTGEVLGSNDDWPDSPDAAEIERVIAATGITINNRAAAVLLTLPAGSYSALVEGATPGDTGIVAAGVADLEDDHRSGGDVSNAGPCSGAEVELPMVNTGVINAAKGKARLRHYADCGKDFRVEIEDVPVGNNYGLTVNGEFWGSFQVVNTGVENEGQIEFDTEPNDPHERLLPFDPAGELIQVTRNGQVILRLNFPTL